MKYQKKPVKSNWFWLFGHDKAGNSYIQLKEKIKCRYLKIKNIEVPGGNFALSGFRVFGNGDEIVPKVPESFTVSRNPDDMRSIKVKWKPVDGATGYNISYGTNNNILYQNYIVYKDSLLEINSLNTNQIYYFTIEAFNENGVSKKSEVVKTNWYYVWFIDLW